MPNLTLSQMGFLDENTQQETVYDLEDPQARSDISTINGKIPTDASSSNKLVTSNELSTGLAGKISTTAKGSANGVASLDSSGLVPAAQLPSYVDDVLEGVAQNVTQTGAGTYSANGFIISGQSSLATLESGKTYVDVTSSIQYRWTGTGNNLVSMGSNLALGETSSTAYSGDKGKANADAISAIKDGISIDSFADVEDALSNKADKVSGATSGNFAGLDSNGNLTDSGSKASDFLPSNTPIPDAVTANPQGTVTGTLTKLGIGSDTYDIYDENSHYITTVAGAHNVLKNERVGQTFGSFGVTITVDENGVIDINGTAIYGDAHLIYSFNSPPTLPQGKYLVSGLLPSTDKYYIYFGERNAANTAYEGFLTHDDNGTGVVYERTNNRHYAFGIQYVEGAVFNHVKVYPIITPDLTTIPPVYKPHSMTNRELTVNKADISAIASNEPNATASRDYIIGEHFYKNREFCTCTQAIAQGATFTLNTNYVEGTVADETVITKEYEFGHDTAAQGQTGLAKFDAGAIGTRGVQCTHDLTDMYNAGYKIISAIILSTTDSSKYIPIVMGHNGPTLYLNLYRATTSAVSDAHTIVRVCFKKI